jgi:hypothetical protein
MKNLIIVFALISGSIYFMTFTSAEAFAPNEPSAAAALTIECPLEIQTGIQNVPADWIPVIAPGAARLNFQEVVLYNEKGKQKIGCFYNNQKGEFALHSLHRATPANHLCKIDKGSEHPRTVDCTPVIIVKKN